MEFNLKYGEQEIRINFPFGKLIEALNPKETNSRKSEKKVIEESINNPIASVKIEDFINSKDKLLIVIPDKTRISRLNIILPILFKKLKKCEINKNNISFIFANGSHSKMDESEKKELLSEHFYRFYKVFEHNAFKKDITEYFGKTKRGTEVVLNKIIKENDKIITIGAVTHHYFAGFGGGAKMIMPGLAYYKTIEQNHKRSITKNGKLNKNCKSGELKNNPIYEDLIEVVKYCPPIFSINILLDEFGKIIAAKSGNIIKSHKEIAKLVNKKYRIKIQKKADLIICSAGGYPKDINLIQTHKSIYNAYQAVKKNGVIICFAECRDGIGSKTFLDWFKYDNETLKSKISHNYSLNAQTAISFIEKINNVKIIMVSKLDPKIAKKMGIILTQNFDEAFTLAKRYLKKEFSYYIIKNSSLVIPSKIN